VWIRASYHPILDLNVQPCKVVVYAQDITEGYTSSLDMKGRNQAIDWSFATAEYDLAGNIVNANHKFLELVGYTMDEIRGRNQRLLTSPVSDAEHALFWEKLGRGEFLSNVHALQGKAGHQVWVGAHYCPVNGADGRPVKVLHLATDITEFMVQANEHETRVNAISRAVAVSEYDLSGTLLTANEHFLSLMGYSLREVSGQNHAMFCSPTRCARAAMPISGARWARASFRAGAITAWPNMSVTCGCRPPATRSMICRARWCASSNMPLTSPIRSAWNATSPTARPKCRDWRKG
jgi:methyl-accepting chemotaxis protein